MPTWGRGAAGGGANPTYVAPGSEMAHIRAQDGEDVPTVEHIELLAVFRIPGPGRAGDEGDVPTVEHTEDHFSIFPHGSRLEEAMPTFEHVEYCFPSKARPMMVTRHGSDCGSEGGSAFFEMEESVGRPFRLGMGGGIVRMQVKLCK